MTSEKHAARRLARRINKTSRETRAMARASQAAYRSVEASDGPVEFYGEDGEVRLQIGPQPDGSVTIVEVNAPPPPIPSEPIVELVKNGVLIIWDGEFEDDATPSDWAFTEVHVMPLPGQEATDLNQVTAFGTDHGGQVYLPLLPSDGARYVSFTAMNQSGVESDKSAEVMVEATFVPDTYPEPETSPDPILQGGVGRVYISVPANETTQGVIYQIHLSETNEPAFVPVLDDPATLVKEFSSTFTSFSTLPNGDTMETGVTYYVSVIAYNAQGAADPSPAVGVARQPISESDIGEETKWVGKMGFDRLEGGALLAEAIIGGEGGIYAAGSSGEKVGLFPDGFRVSGPTFKGNPTYVEFPVSGGPGFFKITVNAITLEVEGDPETGQAMTLFQESTLAAGARLKLESGVQASIAAPTVEQIWESAQVDGFPVAGTSIRGGWFDAGWMYFATTSGEMWRTDDEGTSEFLFNLNDYIPPAPGSSTFILHSFTRIGSRWYFFGIGNYLLQPLHGIMWIEADLSASGVTRWETFASASGIRGIGALGADGSTLLLAIRREASYRIERYTAAGVLDDWIPTALATDTLGGRRQVLAGNFDIGSFRYIVLYENGIQVFVNTGGGSSSHEFPLASSASASIAWDGTRFWTLSSTADTVYRYSVETDTTLSWASFTKSNALLGESTTPSPKKQYTPIKRKFVRITGFHPDTPDATFYVGRGAIEPPNTAMYEQASALGVEEAVLLDEIATSGDNPPLESTLTGLNPAEITSSDELYYFRASGIAKFKELILTSTEDVDILAGNPPPPLRVGNIEGNHLRVDGNELQSMSSDTTVGPLAFQQGGGKVKLTGSSRSFLTMYFGSENIDFNASGEATMAHDMGSTPLMVIGDVTGGINNRQVSALAKGPTNITWKLKNHTNDDLDATVTVDWIAFVQ